MLTPGRTKSPSIRVCSTAFTSDSLRQNSPITKTVEELGTAGVVVLVEGVLVGVGVVLVEGVLVGVTLVEGLAEGKDVGKEVAVAVGLVEGVGDSEEVGEEVGVVVAVALGEVVFVEVTLGKGNGANSKVLAICTNPLSEIPDMFAAVMFTSFRGIVTPTTELLTTVPPNAEAIWAVFKAVWEVIVPVAPMEVMPRTVLRLERMVVRFPWVLHCRNCSLGVSPTM
jgi:hypothetical protein